MGGGGAPPQGPPKGTCGTCQRPIQGPMMQVGFSFCARECVGATHSNSYLPSVSIFQALGRTYHANCFICGSCGEGLGTGTFYQSDGKPTCARCYQVLGHPCVEISRVSDFVLIWQAQFCARCAHCSKPIQGPCISAINKQWHVNCFICAQCLKPFGSSPFFERYTFFVASLPPPRS